MDFRAAQGWKFESFGRLSVPEVATRRSVVARWLEEFGECINLAMEKSGRRGHEAEGGHELEGRQEAEAPRKPVHESSVEDIFIGFSDSLDVFWE